jgi:hypothetical protein
VVDPSAIPRIEGDMDALGGHARALAQVGVGFATTGERIHATWQQLGSVYVAPEAGQLLAATGPVQHVSAAVGEDIRAVARALQTYADTVRPIQQRLEQLRAQAAVLAIVGDGAADGDLDQDRIDEQRRLTGAVDAAVAEFQAAERACANAITTLYGGTQYRADDGDGRREPGEYGYSAQQLARGLGAEPGHPWGAPTGVDPGVLGDVRDMLARLLPDPPAGGSPEQNAAWWASLSPGVQQALMAISPGVLGNLNGLPATVRDQANRARLRSEASRLDAEITRVRAGLAPHRSAPGFQVGYYDELRRLEQLEAKRASVKAIEETLARGDRQLLVLDLSGERAEAAIAIGDVDTAEHVAVFTPGFTTTVDGDGGLKGYDEQMRQLQQQANRRAFESGGGSVATVTWIGYQAPQWSGVLSPSDSVASQGPAERGAVDLAEFYRGINASRADDPHLTAIGHSYGSTTTGLAVQQPGTGVDDVIVAGSPGIGTSDVDDLHVPEGHTYVVEARGDPVADLANFGKDPNTMEGVTGLSAREETAGGSRLGETTGHGIWDDENPRNGYLAQDTSSQYNISVVVAGAPERAVHDRGVGLGDWLW